ncbi:nucleotidyltransferase domain-containing protein [Actinoplanes sp. NPDC049118]|uniref:nucleotidyltransferase domain-containing protein n=1 Tax=Actinoplanes sp. NPDC049118 TaxID=3155769 RepID=UPI003410F15A
MSTEPQLRAIADIVRVAGAGLWLRGGWAMDFYLGRVTRPHRDIDFLCRATDAGRIVAALRGLGYRDLPGNAPAGLQHDLETPAGVDVQVTLLGEDADRCPTVPAGPYAGTRWPADLLSGPPGRIGEVSCAIVSPRAQIEIKEMMPVWVPGLRRREKDRRDVARLRAAMAEREITPGRATIAEHENTPGRTTTAKHENTPGRTTTAKHENTPGRGANPGTMGA